MQIILDIIIVCLIVGFVSGVSKILWIALGLVGSMVFVFFLRTEPTQLTAWDFFFREILFDFFPDILFDLIEKSASGIIRSLSKLFADLGSLTSKILKSAKSIIGSVLKLAFGSLLKSIFGVGVALGIFGVLKR